MNELDELREYKKRARYMLGKLHREAEEKDLEIIRLAKEVERLRKLLQEKKA